MQSSQYITGKHIKARFDVSDTTLKRWAAAKKVRVVRAGGNSTARRLYNADDVALLFGKNVAEQRRDVIVYARVSSEHQRTDLDRQIEQLSKAYPQAEVIKDVASGLDFHRHGFTALLERVCAGSVGQVVVAHRGRLARFAMELVEWIFRKHDTKLVVLDEGEDRCAEDELRDDLLAVTTYFVARNNGRRSAENKKRPQTDSEARKKQKTVGEFGAQDPSTADSSSEAAVDALDEH